MRLCSRAVANIELTLHPANTGGNVAKAGIMKQEQSNSIHEREIYFKSLAPRRLRGLAAGTRLKRRPSAGLLNKKDIRNLRSAVHGFYIVRASKSLEDSKQSSRS